MRPFVMRMANNRRDDDGEPRRAVYRAARIAAIIPRHRDYTKEVIPHSSRDSSRAYTAHETRRHMSRSHATSFSPASETTTSRIDESRVDSRIARDLTIEEYTFPSLAAERIFITLAVRGTFLPRLRLVASHASLSCQARNKISKLE